VIWSDYYLVSGPVGDRKQPLEIWHQSFAPKATGTGVTSGHFVAEENPGATLEALRAFLKG
jgi:haloacetate dehalogenase